MAESNNDSLFNLNKISESKTFGFLGKNWAFLFLVMMLILFSFLGENFLSLNNFNNIILGISSLLLLASGETFVIISGGIDLSIGFVMGFVCVSSAIIMRDLNAAGYSPVISIMAGSFAGLL